MWGVLKGLVKSTGEGVSSVSLKLVEFVKSDVERCDKANKRGPEERQKSLRECRACPTDPGSGQRAMYDSMGRDEGCSGNTVRRTRHGPPLKN